MNEFLCGHIVFTTTDGTGTIPVRAGNYNATVAYLDLGEGPVVGSYVVTVGAALAPPIDADSDIDVSSSLTTSNLWTDTTVTFLGFSANQDRRYQVDVFQADPGPGPTTGDVIAETVGGVTVRFNVKRVEPRTS